MKTSNKLFSSREKKLLLILVLVIAAAGYFLLVEQPLRSRMTNAEVEEASLQTELSQVEQQITDLKRMKEEMEVLDLAEAGYMASYNNREAEISLLNDALRLANSYSISFAEVSRDGNQIRRNINVQFTAKNYSNAKKILNELASGPYRCLLNDVSFSSSKGSLKKGEIAGSFSMTYYETMVGSNDNAGLFAEGENSESGNAEGL